MCKTYLSNRSKTRGVIAGLVPAMTIRMAQVPDYRDGRDKPGHDQVELRLPIPPQGHGARIIAAGSARSTQKCRLREGRQRDAESLWAQSAASARSAGAGCGGFE